ncbi:hypothetical protein [Sphaerisporangium dianthi]|uniref:Uncharacterized protein n=1 Tax=Sphaerisporangium dianthi TaxID=1436120 RepID=A0ABV9CS67_9ACTN
MLDFHRPDRVATPVTGERRAAWRDGLARGRRDGEAEAGNHGVLSGWVRWSLVAGLIVFAPVCAECLLGYDESIGDPVALVAGLLPAAYRLNRPARNGG